VSEDKSEIFQAQARRAIAIMREAGLDPGKVYASPLAREVAIQWSSGDLDDLQLMRALVNLAIFDPSLLAS
jgi:hypothetical protein